MTRQEYKARQTSWKVMDCAMRFQSDYVLRVDTLNLIGRVRKSFGKGEVLRALLSVYRNIPLETRIP